MNSANDNRGPVGMLRHADEILLKTVRIILIVLMTMMVGSVLLQVITRYGFGFSISWSEELARLSLISSIFLGAAILTRSEDHLKVDTFILLLPGRARSGLAIAANMVGIYCTGYLISGSFRALNREWSQLTPAMQLPMGAIYSIVFFSTLLMVLFLAVNVLRHAYDVIKGNPPK